MALNKHIFAKQSIYNSTAKLDIISIGEVMSIDDSADAGRIIVSVKGVDDNIAVKDIKPAFPLLPKHLQVMPKVGESVFIMKLDLDDTNYVNSYWIGPIISQPQKLNKDPHFFSSKAALPDGVVDLESAPSLNRNADGVFPQKNHISIQGRNNSDLIFKDNEALLRAGQHVVGNNLKFNTKNIGYIQIKHNVTLDVKVEGKETKAQNLTVSNIVAEKINLITHKATKNFDVSNQSNLISDEEMSRIINEAHPIPYGDILRDYLEAHKAYTLAHVHPYHGSKPVADKTVADNFINFDLSRINSKNIKID